ncbi:hypothetical protein TWF694_003199 [Orbilia ellipsospora]|uniref:Sulfotransferase domain-containing protein n=1 Tax=Orbilia ellipsospora TaxID=2528407 RepID=A0AAV9X246_9PEZI
MLSSGLKKALQPIYIFSHPRVCSNLFLKLLSQHPQLYFKTYTFAESFFHGPEKLDRRVIQGEKTTAKDHPETEIRKPVSYQAAFDELNEFIIETRAKGKVPAIKDHIRLLLDPWIAATEFQYNVPRKILPSPIVEMRPSKSLPTVPHTGGTEAPCPIVLPPEFLLAVRPIMLIRDPIRVIPSFYKASVDSFGARIGDEDWPIDASLKCTRLLYDWYCNNGITPILVDAYELVHYTEEVMRGVCEKLEIDFSGVIVSWSRCDWIESDRGYQDWRGTLWNSTKIDPTLEPENADIEEEFTKWRGIWGDEIAGGLKRSVGLAKEDYVYLRQHALGTNGEYTLQLY